MVIFEQQGAVLSEAILMLCGTLRQESDIEKTAGMFLGKSLKISVKGLIDSTVFTSYLTVGIDFCQVVGQGCVDNRRIVGSALLFCISATLKKMQGIDTYCK